MYVIWSNEHRAWWRPSKLGYTKNIGQAGIYSRDDAIDICDDATRDWTVAPNEVPVQIADLPHDAKALLGQA